MSFYSELKRRNIFRAGLAYLVSCWLLIEVASLMFEAFEFPDWSLKLLITLMALGLFPILMFSWAFEMTTEGIRKQKDVDPSKSISLLTGKRLDQITIMMVLLALTVVIVERFVLPHKPIPEVVSVEQTVPQLPEIKSESIAVLPFVNMSSDKENEYFSEGLSETLLHMLARIKDLKVAARTSSFAYRGKDIDVRKIGEELGVANVLEGSVQKNNGRVRITAQLIRANDGIHIWSESFDRELADVFAIQDEIATKVVKALKISLLGAEPQRLTKKRTSNVEAYQEYLLGMRLLPDRKVEELKRALLHFERAIELDDEFAMALVAAANTYTLLEQYGDFKQPQRVKQTNYISRAMLLDPELGEAYTAMGEELRIKGDFDSSEKAFQRAKILAPSYATTYHWYGLLLRENSGRPLEALELHRIAHELDPLSPVIHLNLGLSHWASGLANEAKQEFKRINQRHPEYPAGYSTLGLIEAYHDNNFAESIKWFAKYNKLQPSGVGYAVQQCGVFIEINNFDRVRKCIAWFEQKAPNSYHIDPLIVLEAYAQNDLEKAINIAQDKLPTFQGDGRFKQLLAYLLLLKGDSKQSLSLYQQTDADVFDLSYKNIAPARLWHTAHIALALREENEVEAYQRLLERLLLAIEIDKEKRSYFYFNVSPNLVDVIIYTLADMEEKALSALEEAADKKWIVGHWLIREHPALSKLKLNPRFTAAMRAIDSIIAEQQQLTKDLRMLP